MPDTIQQVAIIGGGTAGWLTACILAKQFQQARSSEHTIQITLVESSQISTIGVGEGTWPTMRQTLHSVGISETDLIQHCHATFKQGSQFINWRKSPENATPPQAASQTANQAESQSASDRYFHPFTAPIAYGKFDLNPYWNEANHGVYAEAVCHQQQLCAAGLAPKTMTDKEYQGFMNYGYHLDAVKLAELLKKQATEKLGVTHLDETVEQVQLNDAQQIGQIQFQSGNSLQADFYIDCTGFKSLLLGKTYGIPWRDCSDVLLANRALAVQVPYESDNDAIACQTNSTAQTAGWIWDIGLSSRRGVGYVFSDQHIFQEEAHLQLASYLGVAPESIEPKSIQFNPGYREKFFHQNCVAIGLSAGFLEPLEASALMLIEISAKFIAEQLPRQKSLLPLVEKRFNHTFHYRWQRIIDFLKLHYTLSTRHEEFWLDSRASRSIPESLTELLSLWQERAPLDLDFDSSFEVFPAASYKYILYGMGFHSEFHRAATDATTTEQAEQLFKTNQKAAKQSAQRAISHRELINRIKQHGLHHI